MGSPTLNKLTKNELFNCAYHNSNNSVCAGKNVKAIKKFVMLRNYLQLLSPKPTPCNLDCELDIDETDDYSFHESMLNPLYD